MLSHSDASCEILQNSLRLLCSIGTAVVCFAGELGGQRSVTVFRPQEDTDDSQPSVYASVLADGLHLCWPA